MLNPDTTVLTLDDQNAPDVNIQSVQVPKAAAFITLSLSHAIPLVCFTFDLLFVFGSLSEFSVSAISE
jgi:hypothetical protein